MLDDIDRAPLQVLQWDGQISDAEFGFLGRMRSSPEVLECHRVAGDYSYLLKLCLTGIGHLERIIALSSAKETRAIDTSAIGSSG
jgi:DNA-binding Lrp family transcriptional regulator